MKNNKIDAVILWVDDTDEQWLKKKIKWQNHYGIEDNMPERYRNWDNLHYIFRGIEKFAPWINHIYLVTDWQKPSWLKENKNITVVDHQDIIPEKYLPTFNSGAIELNIHKIKGLSENFLFFNDDFFIIDHVKEEDFFQNGLPRDYAISNPIIPHKNKMTTYRVFNNLTIINEKFNQREAIKRNPTNWINFKYGILNIQSILLNIRWRGFSGFYEPHSIQSYLKSTFENVWSEYGEDLEVMMSSKFRAPNNYNQWLMRYWQLADNKFVPRSPKFSKVYALNDKRKIDKCATDIRKQKKRVVCVNDGEGLTDFEYAKETVNKALNSILNEKSRFEF